MWDAMTDVIDAIAEMSWRVKSAWLVWFAWLAVQVAWYRWGQRHVPASEPVRSVSPERPAASRPVAVDTTRYPAAGAVDTPPSSHRHRRRRPRPEPAATTDLTEGVEAAR
jgi:hypothetical protein